MSEAERCWRLRFFPHSRISQVDPIVVRDCLIGVFQRWGMPLYVKVDNGQPFGDPQKKTIPALALWLISLDVGVIWNRPRQPRDNAKVERMQGTSGRWVDLDRCADREQLAQALAQVALVQREHYEVSRLNFKTRTVVFPALFEIQRPYLSQGFDAARVYRFLSKTTLVRKVSSTGRIRLYEHGYQVGFKYKGEQVAIRLDAEALDWLVCNRQGEQIKRLPAKCLSPAHIWSLSVSQRTRSDESL